MTVMHGLFPALDELLLEVDQMFCVKYSFLLSHILYVIFGYLWYAICGYLICVRHLYNNFRKQFPDVKLKELIWKTFTVTHSNAW